MSSSAAYPISSDSGRKEGRYRVERHFISQRSGRELVYDLLRAHSGR